MSGSDVLCAEEAEADKHQMFATKSVNVLIQVHEAERYICADEEPQSAFTNETWKDTSSALTSPEIIVLFSHNCRVRWIASAFVGEF